MIFNFVQSMDRSVKRLILIGLDLFSAAAAVLLTWSLVLGRLPQPAENQFLFALSGVLLSFTLAMVVALGLHKIKLNTYEIKGIVENSVVAIGIGLIGGTYNAIAGPVLPAQAFVVLAMAYAILSVGMRLSLKAYVIWLYANARQRKRVLIYGAGQTGQQLAGALHTDDAFAAVAFVDDNPALQGMMINGLKVVSPVQIRQVVKEKQVDRVVIAMPSASSATRAAIARRLSDIGCEVHSVPSFAELVVDVSNPGRSRGVDVAGLLGRHALDRQLPAVNGAYRGRSVLVTGAGGSIGSELCRQLLACAPKRLVLLDHSEHALYKIHREMSAAAGECEVVPVLGSVCAPDTVRRTLAENRIDVVLHAAAYKHVPMVEENALEGLRNNVFGTRTMAQEAAEAGVERFILVSTDKAVRPTSVMGASKRMAELVVQDLAARAPQTRFSMVRFGNVLGSSGSVIPLFQEQILEGGPVTVTHRDVTRYFMTVSEAVSLVLLAGTYARGGEVFVLNMGKPVRIERLARQMIRNAGYSVRDEANPDGDIEIRFTGLRSGEKLHEELLIGSDMLTTPHSKILRAQEDGLESRELEELLNQLQRAIESSDEDQAREAIARWIESQNSGSVRHLDMFKRRLVGRKLAPAAETVS